jgi:hypothetical protein
MSAIAPHAMRRATVVWTALLAIGGCLVAAQGASASSIAVTASPNPAKVGATVTLTNTGSTSEATPAPSTLIYDYYEPNTAPCASTAANERTRSHGEAYITTLEQNPSTSFNDQTTFIPRAGADSYRICAYLYTGGDDSVAPEAVGTTLLSIPPTRAQLLARAIKKCKKKTNKARRAKCVSAAKKLYGPKK